MKLKGMLLTLAGIALTCTLFAGNSFATWAACTPAQLGPQGALVRLQVTACNVNPAGAKNGWMTLNSTGTDQQMATILTAMSLGKPIAVEFDGTTDASGYNIAKAIIFNNK